jgi:AraC-like DNA-binding protein
MRYSDYLEKSLFITGEREHDFVGEKQRWWTEWAESIESREINNLEVTILKRAPLYLWRSGICECTREFARRRESKTRARRMFGIELVTAGNAEVVQNGKLFKVGTGEIFLLHNYADLTWRTGSAGFLNKRFVMIDGPALDIMLRSTNLINYTCIKPPSSQKIVQLFKQANMLLGGKDPDHQEKLMKLAFEILLEISAPVRFKEYPDPITKALELMNSRLKTDLSMAELAKATNVSQSHLFELFQKYLGASPLNLYLSLKTEYAKTLLSDQNLTIKEIAEECGYNDPYTFSKQFKKFAGMSPNAYRKVSPSA